MAVTVKYLSNVMTNDSLVGLEVADVQERCADAFSMPSDVSPFVNGASVSFETVLQDGDTLEFRKSHGEKGC